MNWWEEYGARVTIAIGVVAGLSLILNLVVLAGWLGFRSDVNRLSPSVESALNESVADIASLRESTLTFEVDIDESLPISATIPLNRTFQVPIVTSFPITETFLVDVVVPGPFGIEIPFQAEVPVDMDVPIDVVVPVQIADDIPIDLDLPVELRLPVTVDVSGTDLGPLLQTLETRLAEIARIVAELG
ncbi:MAG: hypothetical protein KJO84_05485 [Acidimicrobiia bacterium]|nr:hypothetical protein [Acidimicrobiia bacterium]NNC75891.1 hypothetical protein [Acidimicrobiia bacterium]